MSGILPGSIKPNYIWYYSFIPVVGTLMLSVGQYRKVQYECIEGVHINTESTDVLMSQIPRHL